MHALLAEIVPVSIMVLVLEIGSIVLTKFVKIETIPLEAGPESSYPDAFSGDRRKQMVRRR